MAKYNCSGNVWYGHLRLSLGGGSNVNSLVAGFPVRVFNKKSMT